MTIDDVPLVTVAKLGQVETMLQKDYMWELTSETGGTRRREKSCGLLQARYFFAGRVCPTFGEIAFVYSPEVEVVKEGSANPFDTGGVIDGHCFPHKRMEEKDRLNNAENLISNTKKPILEWRDGEKGLGDFINDFFEGNVTAYLLGHCHDRSVELPYNYSKLNFFKEKWHEHLPVLYLENKQDIRSRTWEVRIEQSFHCLTSIKVCCVLNKDNPNDDGDILAEQRRKLRENGGIEHPIWQLPTPHKTLFLTAGKLQDLIAKNQI